MITDKICSPPEVCGHAEGSKLEHLLAPARVAVRDATVGGGLGIDSPP